MEIKYEFREMTEAELKREQAAFNENGLEFGNPQTSKNGSLLLQQMMEGLLEPLVV